MPSKIKCGIRCLFAALLVVACGGEDAQQAKPSPILKAFPPDASAQVPGLQSPVDILRDRWGVPHVYAANDMDLSMAMGYLHAQDRLFLMDTLRHIAKGRLGEYLGKPVLELDITLRTIMMTNTGKPVSEAILEKVDPHTLGLLEAYSRGVNQYLKELRLGRWDLPPGYRVPALASLSPTDIPDWEPSDTIAAGRLQELGLTSGTAQEDLQRGQWFSMLSPENFADLTRLSPADPTLVLPDWLSSLRSRLMAPAPAKAVDLSRWDFAEALERVKIPGETGFSRQQRGSNNWVIGGAHTQSGHAIVANDPHLDFTTPATFYHAHLNSKLLRKDSSRRGYNLIGVTTPGSPDVILGHNEDVAWGGTVVGWDVADAYLEQLDETGNATRFRGEMVPISRFVETFKLGFGPQAQTLQHEIEYVPHHGPIVSKDLENKTAISVKWTGRMPSLELAAFGEMSRARNVGEFVSALSGLTVLAQNWNAADREGKLAYFPYAHVPVRASVTGACRPYLPMDGTGPCEWVGLVEASKIPAKMQDRSGWLVTANNDVIGQLADNDPSNDAVYLHSDRALGFRAGRITQVIQEWIREGKKISVDDVIGLQGDVHSLLAKRLLPHLFAAATALPNQAQALMPAIERLRAWDLEMASGVGPQASPAEIERSIAASIYSVFLVKLAQQTLGDELAQAGVELPGTYQIKTLLMLLERPELQKAPQSYWDRVDTADKVESKDQVLLASLKLALDTLASSEGFSSPDPQTWRWGQLHQMQILDPTAMFTGQPLRSVGPFPRKGGNFTVDVASQRGVSTDFSFRAGPQMRFVAEMRPEGPVAVNALPGGQSDDPDSPHYDDLLKRWLGNETFPYYFKLQEVMDNKEQYLRWTPAP